MPFIGTQPRAGAYSLLDSITVSATNTFNLTLDGDAYYPQSPNHLIVSLNGVIQAPVNSFTISGSQITFSENLLVTDTIDFILALGDVLSIGTPSDNAVTTLSIQNGAVTSSKLDTNIAITGNLQVGGSDVLVDTDIGSTVQAYDADTAKLDVAQTFTANQTINGDLTVDTNTLYVDSASNEVGIGTSSPSYKLHINGGSVGINDGSDRAIITNTTSDGADTGDLYLNGGGASSVNRGAYLRLYGNEHITEAGVVDLGGGNTGTSYIKFTASITERMRITSAGNVGIGTSSPTQKLDVSGTVNATAFIGDGSALTNITDTVAPTRHSIQPSLNLDFANSKVLDPRITFTRASNATYYDGYTSVKAEENLLLRSQEIGGISWSVVGGTASINSAVAPDGTTTASTVTSTSADCYIVQNMSMTSGLTYTFSLWMRAASATTIKFGIATTYTAAVSVTTSWQRFTITVPYSGANRVIIGGILSFPSTSPEIYVWGAQLEQRDTVTAYTPTTTSPITKYQPALQTAGNNVARFDHNPTTGESLGLLIEEGRTNLNTYSEDTSGYQKGRSNTTDNIIIAPDGTLTGNKIVGTAVSGSHYVTTTYSASGSLPTGSAYVKAGEKDYVGIQIINDNGTAAGSDLHLYNLSTGTLVSGNDNPTITEVGNGWYRISVTADTTATTNYGVRVFVYDGTNQSWTGDEYSGAYVWGVQLEEGSFPTSYIKTTGSQVTRSADDCEMLNIDQDDWLKQGAGTLYGEFSKPYTGQDDGINIYPRIFSLTNDQFDTNEISIYFAQITTASIASYITKDGVNYNNNILIQSPLANTYYKASIAYERNNVDASGNGSDETTDTSAEIPFINRLRIFKRAGYQGNGNYGTIKKLSYYPIKLTKNEVIDLTEI